jgi:hypothetical protein
LRANFQIAPLTVFSKLYCFCSFGVLFKSLKLSPSWMVWLPSSKRRLPDRTPSRRLLSYL